MKASQTIKNISTVQSSKNDNTKSIMKKEDMFNLPTYVLKLFCTEWIKIEDIARLDRALCESINRNFLNAVLNGINYLV
jgi:hypothetical protein